MNSIYTICYVSKVAPNLSDKDIQDLFKFTATINNKNKISGILLHSLDNFFQVLEGDEKCLKDLYNKIKEDPRHYELYEVYNKMTTHPVFSNYKSTFDIVKTASDLKLVLAYLNQDIANSTNRKLKRLLTPFDLLGDF